MQRAQIHGERLQVISLAMVVMTAGAARPQSCAETALGEYVGLGSYDLALGQTSAGGQIWLDVASRRFGGDGPLALVLDIDETTLSNLEVLEPDGFCLDTAAFVEYWRSAACPALTATRDLFDHARALGIDVFFITGRAERLRSPTRANLDAQGLGDHAGLYLEPDDWSGTTVEFKSGAREEIEGLGYTIVLNVGDQLSDLGGGHAVRTLLAPNPFYFVP